MDHEEGDGGGGEVFSFRQKNTECNQDGLAIGNLFRAHFAAVYKWAEANLHFVMNVLQVIFTLVLKPPPIDC